jgi:protocatechuate 3,4-dioxygenase beta subunit
MENSQSLSRRKLLGLGASAAGVAIASTAFAMCNGALTPAQTEGPFYPVSSQPDEDADLTQVAGKSGTAAGRVIYIAGRVLDENCRPIPNAVVEIWQASANGRYNHPGDPNPAPIDPNFQYWGRSMTEADGTYAFKTVMPGEYQATDDWIRPPHIHFKVHRRGFHEFTSQLYFAGEEHNAGDRVLQGLKPDERKRVIVELDSQGLGRFDITLSSV